jgi:hypothetical protein
VCTACRAIAARRSHACKLLNFAKDGTPLWNQLAVVPVRRPCGRVTHWIGIAQFTPAARVEGVPSGLARVGSHQCVRSAGSLASSARGGLGASRRSSSYQELAMPAGAALHALSMW